MTNARAVYQVSTHKAHQAGIVSETGFDFQANLPQAEQLGNQLKDSAPSPASGGLLKNLQAVLPHWQAFFFDDMSAQSSAASKNVFIRPPRQYAIFPAHYFW
ncbi:hypothetical protein [Rhodoflexus caldus]|uniref:hypothetical protein n=1 Tax=Rhodoflexus caldus TaxID=2891236 RepID=UPI00202A3DA9|nr:hypothetical protein [Rhodoflexus caldus]